METERLPFNASLEQYQQQASQLFERYQSGDPLAIQVIRQHHPRFLRPDVPWLPLNVPDSEVQNSGLSLEDCQTALARGYDFADWRALAEYAEAVSRTDSPVFEFESAVESLITGDADTLRSLLRKNPELVRARSTRVTHFDPPAHRAMLLHYIAANGVEGYRQKTPANAVEIARILLESGAEVDALADLYGGQCTTMSLLVSSCHPAKAGVQVPLVHTLVDFGAAVEPRGAGRWTSPLMTALVFGYQDAAAALVERGAPIDNLAAAAGLGRLTEARELLPSADADSRHRALALAAQNGHAEIVALLLDAGEDPNRYNPEGFHAHSTPLHQAAIAERDQVVRLLVERGARLDIKDRIYDCTPLDWAVYERKVGIAEYLRNYRSPLP